MEIDEAVIEHLKADADIVQHVDHRIYPGHAPQGEPFPYVTVDLFTTDHEYHLGGGLGLDRSLLQIDIWCKESSGGRPKLIEISNPLISRLDAYRGQLATTGVFSRGSFIRRDSITQEEPTDSSDNWLWRRSIDFEIAHPATVPAG